MGSVQTIEVVREQRPVSDSGQIPLEIVKIPHEEKGVTNKCRIVLSDTDNDMESNLKSYMSSMYVKFYDSIKRNQQKDLFQAL